MGRCPAPLLGGHYGTRQGMRRRAHRARTARQPMRLQRSVASDAEERARDGRRPPPARPLSPSGRAPSGHTPSEAFPHSGGERMILRHNRPTVADMRAMKARGRKIPMLYVTTLEEAAAAAAAGIDMLSIEGKF